MKKVRIKTISRLLTLTVLAISLLTNCQSDHKTYLHISHTRSYDGAEGKVMETVEKLDYNKYDLLMLGGDLTLESTGKPETLDYLNKIFDLSNPDVLWTLGNHDYLRHPEWISKTTKRPGFYAHYKNDIAYLVFNSQENNCNTVGEQKDLLDETLDNLAPATTHLIVLHHKLVWMMDGGQLEETADTISNGEKGNCSYCLSPNNFYESVYPKLVKVQQSGCQVICIAGDLGGKKDQFSHKTAEGIYLLASGLRDGSKENNKVLLFEHDLKNKVLTWEFSALNDL